MRQYAARTATAAALGLAACASDPTSPGTQAAGGPSLSRDSRSSSASSGAVYTMTNATTGNAIVALRRAADGTLSPLGTYATGGTGRGGTIDPLQSQYSVLLSDDHHLLYTVDPGSNTIASFRVADDGALSLVDRGTSGGTFPVSLARFKNVLYVLNRGDNTLYGYRAAEGGHLAPFPGGARALSPGADGASTVHFSTDGRTLIVTERLSNRIETFPVLPNGRLGDAVITASAAATPFGFDVVGTTVIVADATFIGQNSAASSYQLGANSTLSVRTAALDDQGRAACWAIATRDGRYAYTVNAVSSDLTPLAVSGSGQLSLLNPANPVVSTGAQSFPLDPAFSTGEEFLYVLKAGTGTVATFRVGADHGLTATADTPVGAPASGFGGLAAY